MPTFHYCSTDTFLKILDSECIWFSDLSKSNDKTEGQHIKRVFRDAWHKFSGEQAFGEDVFDLFDNFLDSNSAFGMCTSSDGDLLSQWRGYANNGTGFSIGFGRECRGTQQDCTTASRFPLDRRAIEYEPERQIDSLKPFIQKILNQCDADGIIKDKFLMPLKYEISPLTILSCFDPIIKSIAYTIKHSAFKEEQEVRFFLTTLENDNRNEECQYFSRPSMIVPYIPIPLSELPTISTVIIGPRNNTAIPAVKHILESKSIFNVDIRYSDVPYR